MTTGDAYQEPEEEAVEHRCSICGHGESDHVIEEMGEAGSEWTRRATRCVICGDWHEFTPRPEDE